MSAIVKKKNDEIICPFCYVNLSATREYKVKRGSGFIHCYNCGNDFEIDNINGDEVYDAEYINKET